MADSKTTTQTITLNPRTQKARQLIRLHGNVWEVLRQGPAACVSKSMSDLKIGITIRPVGGDWQTTRTIAAANDSNFLIGE